MRGSELTEREKSILRYVIQQFILTANPVGSRFISKKSDIGLSPASIRNIMSDLEDVGFLNHPHTSAGRVPTDKGYRYYVDALMGPVFLNEHEKTQIDRELNGASFETNDLLKLAGSILSSLTHQIACVSFPRFEKAILEKIQLVRLSTSRLLVVVTIKSGLVKTITLELDAKVEKNDLRVLELLFNSRLSGLTFVEIKESISERVKDRMNSELNPILRVFIDSADKIFTDLKDNDNAFITGASNLLNQPEFGDSEHFQGIIELFENKNVIVHIMHEKNKDNPEDVIISIGSESEDEKFSEYSLITKEYRVGKGIGTLGIIGPKRMSYSKAVASIIYIAEKLSKELKVLNL